MSGNQWTDFTWEIGISVIYANNKISVHYPHQRMSCSPWDPLIYQIYYFVVNVKFCLSIWHSCSNMTTCSCKTVRNTGCICCPRRRPPRPRRSRRRSSSSWGSTCWGWWRCCAAPWWPARDTLTTYSLLVSSGPAAWHQDSRYLHRRDIYTG